MKKAKPAGGRPKLKAEFQKTGLTIADHQLGRRALLIELNPDYCAIIRDRCAITPGFAFA